MYIKNLNIDYLVAQTRACETASRHGDDVWLIWDEHKEKRRNKKQNKQIKYAMEAKEEKKMVSKCLILTRSTEFSARKARRTCNNNETAKKTEDGR